MSFSRFFQVFSEEKKMVLFLGQVKYGDNAIDISYSFNEEDGYGIRQLGVSDKH